ncbi:Hypothetical protein ORPV_962 [Orpheovirus IHUMI-LCC2]|uniref:Uncharacterized protein n=1 Tax=Orpheovirus IHUMI-LCC2 TaxID=2023057 RepID=A0A2I2L5R9_9VIRU|nr:Hypothetical protein ORPV_962 [Orpheovirus IHUMI-LCC2]SNW62866.1 Hypothetical protein ORPV_962 [Orpheovirus IHUMI-LCC2]
MLGSYSGCRSWMIQSLGKNKPVTKQKKPERQKKIVHPIFAECSALVTNPDDKIWKELFDNASGGKLPPGYTCTNKDNILKLKYNMNRKGKSTKKGDKEKDRVLEVPTSGIDALVLCKNFFRKWTGIMTETERKKYEHDIIQDQIRKMENITWAQIKKDRIKKNKYIDAYVDKVCATHHLNDDMKESLSTVINAGLSSGAIKNKDVIMTDGEISHIDGIGYIQDVGFNLLKEVKAKKSKPKVTHDKNASLYKEKWDEFLNIIINEYKNVDPKSTANDKTGNVSTADTELDTEHSTSEIN